MRVHRDCRHSDCIISSTIKPTSVLDTRPLKGAWEHETIRSYVLWLVASYSWTATFDEGLLCSIDSQTPANGPSKRCRREIEYNVEWLKSVEMNTQAQPQHGTDRPQTNVSSLTTNTYHIIRSLIHIITPYFILFYFISFHPIPYHASASPTLSRLWSYSFGSPAAILQVHPITFSRTT
jgi:hypothetical protein